MRATSQVEMTALDLATEEADRALEALLARPSSSPQEFFDKIRALDSEYEDYWQPRHIQALRTDLARLAPA